MLQKRYFIKTTSKREFGKNILTREYSMSKVPMWLATYKVPIKSFMPVEKYVKKATTRTTKKMALGSTTMPLVSSPLK